MIERIVERIREVESVDEIHVVTNSKFAGAFSEWAPADVTVHDDGTTSEDDRRGAIGDTQFVIEQAGIDDDLLIVAGDNLFDYSLEDYVQWWRGKGVASAVALYEHPDLELVKQYGVVAIDDDERVVSFVEKPPEPESNLAATAYYLYHREHLPLISTYLEEGNSPDQPGRLVEWLHRRAPVYGYRFSGEWLDIGDKNQLLEADNLARVRAGQEPRAEYAPD
jgi:glucose-1-phosphate thymidylyltransferase